MAKSRVGPTGRVIAIEPSPDLFASFVAGLASSSPKTDCLNVGLSDASGKMTLYWNPSVPNHDPTMVPQTGGASAEVMVRTLDEVAGELGIDGIDVLKVDVDGFEHRVMLGARRMLAAGAIWMIMMEFNDHWLRAAGTSIPELWRLLHDYGFVDHRGRPAPDPKVDGPWPNRLLVRQGGVSAAR